MTTNRSLGVKIRVVGAFALFFAALTVMIALAAPAQQAGTGQPSAQSSAASVPSQVGTPATAMLPLPPGVGNAQGAPSSRPAKKKLRAAAMGPDTPLFLPAVAYNSGGFGTLSVAVADLNGDGKPDIAVGNYLSNTVAVLLGNGDGTFQPAVTYASGGSEPFAVAIADLNGDGRPDIVVVNFVSASVGVLLGNGDGTFKPAVVYGTGGSDPHSVAIADLNGDGKPDLAISNLGTPNYGVGNLAVLLGNGDGTFQPATTYGHVQSEWVAIADVNRDGKLDLLAADLLNVGVLLGNGDGTFQAPVNYSSGANYAWSVTGADVNGDGKPDLVIANADLGGGDCSGVGFVSVLLGNGDGTFQPAVLFGSGGCEPQQVAVVDANGDGKADLLVANDCDSSGCPSGSVGVLLGNGDGTFQPAVTYLSIGVYATSIAVADLNGDGKPDVVLASAFSTGSIYGTVSVLLNNSTGPLNPTATTLVSSLNPSTYGQTLTFTATVKSTSGTPTGTVQILKGTTVVGSGTLTNGNVPIPVSSLPVGLNSLTAAYQGGGGFAPSTSALLTQTVSMATTTTTLASSLNPAATGQPVTFTATVTSQFGGAATGSVVFFSGSQTLGTGSLTGNHATLTTSFAAVGTYSISAKYNGDGNNTGSTSSNLSQVIIATTTTTLVSSLNPSLVGQAVTFTATVSSSAGAPPNGELITFKNGSAILGTPPLTGGIASLTTSSLAAGVYTITANYGGDANFTASTSPGLRQVVNNTTKSTTSTTLVSSLNPSIYGQKVTWSATVTTSGSVPPTGSVTFSWSGYNIGTSTLNSSGVATLSKSNLNVYTYPLIAVYKGDTSNLGSTSAILNQVVKQATSAATLSSSPNPSTVGQAVTFTATITSPTVVPTGPVTFTAGKTVLGTAQLSGGKAKFTTSTLAVGSTTVTGTYYGDSNIGESSASVTQVVNQ